ncbi:Inorganic pyrophosphatase [Pseudocohnilembus persalinus]|uniref:Inorganic pyrophosphatase n=1 Tax=Pseudocohnilembus persalinus TaxID=266149 RepID=A0A0V0R2P7_PSEPJ|nr:Inorganic pyrophosphatase [Pseudocohnilembus persalinus]|eukprot:KRX08544.1 Inorganic pyrophosphatase [Pseudocohnilembus persalinus]
MLKKTTSAQDRKLSLDRDCGYGYVENMKHPLHGVDIGDEYPEIVNCVIEIPKGSQAKYEIDKDSGLIKLDRVLFSSVHYPAAYGYIPRTYCDDQDPLDILVLCSVDVVPLTLMKARVLGVMEMLDQGEEDDKIIAVACGDVSYRDVKTLDDLPPYTMAAIKRFFEDYKKLEGKQVSVSEFEGKEHALTIVKQAVADYKEKFPQNPISNAQSKQTSAKKE